MKTNQKAETKIYINSFNELIDQTEPNSKDIISLNWNMYQVFTFVGDKKSAKEYLENSYLELKSRSKNIKNIADRNQYLSVKLHQDISKIWNK
jgi:hypothetical protein